MGDEAAELRHDLVERLRDQGHLSDDRVADAFATVPREAFLPEHAARLGLAAVYRDEAIVTRRDPVSRMPTSSSSQPAIMARMLEMLDLRDGQRVLEVGAGTGYNAALLSRLVGRKGNVTSVELDREVAAGPGGAAGDTVGGVGGGGRRACRRPRRRPRRPHRGHREQRGGPPALVRPAGAGRGARAAPAAQPVLFSVQVVVALRKVSSGFDTVAASSGAFMAMRGPSATGDARPAQAVVAEHADARHDRPVLRLTGPALAGLDAAGRQRLLVTALGFSRRRQVALDGASSWALASYAALDLPEERQCELVGGFPWMGPRELSLGVVDAADGSLALLIGDSTSARMAAFGGANAEHALLGVLSRWRAAGAAGDRRGHPAGALRLAAPAGLAHPAPQRPLGGGRLGRPGHALGGCSAAPSLRRMELAAFQQLIDDTYGERDRARGVPATVAWLAEEVGELAQAVRKGSRAEQLHELGDVLAWLASLADQLGLSLDDAAAALRRRLPRLRQPSPCTCADGGGWRRPSRPSGRRLSGRRAARRSGTALRAAPLRRLSLDTNRARPCVDAVGSRRMRPT